MTELATGTASVSAWPDDDTVILANRVVRPGTPQSRLSRFGDAVWILQPAHPDAHHVVNSLRWVRFPEQLVLVFKTFALAALDHPYPPVLAIDRRSQRMAVDTVTMTVRDLRVFAQWMSDQGLETLTEVTNGRLDAYRGHVLALAISALRKASLLSTVRVLWGFRDLLPEQCKLPEAAPWNGASGHGLAKVPPHGGGTKTPRIAPATMESLLGWSLRMLEDFGPDIADAWQEYRQLCDGVHPSQRRFDDLTRPDRVALFLADAQRDGTALPGQRSTNGGWETSPSHLSRLLGIGSHLSSGQLRRVSESGLPIAPGSFLGTVSGRLGGRPWRDQPITVDEIQNLVRFLTAACFVIVCYLSGLRPGEALNLRRGCRDVDPDTGQLLLVGRAGKGSDRQPATGGDDVLTRPWVVVSPVHTAIAMLERLTPHPLVFPASIVAAHQRRPADEHARVSRYMTRDLEQFADWVNTTFATPGGGPPIPPDPTKHIHARRFRRSLAYFIVRRPRGLIAAALQYGHVSTRVTLNYSGTADTSWMEDLAVERLELVLEQTDRDWTLLEDGEHVSGPSAQEYRDRIARARRFEGRVVNRARNLERLLARTDSNIHHGEAMTCVWRTETAACRKAKLNQDCPPTTLPTNQNVTRPARTWPTQTATSSRSIRRPQRWSRPPQIRWRPGPSGTGPSPGPHSNVPSSNATNPPGTKPEPRKASTDEPYSPRTGGRTRRDQSSR
jgi:integrase